MADPILAVKRELLVRYLEAWTPIALHRGRRVSYLHGYAEQDGGQAAEAAWRVLVDLADRLRGRQLSMVAVAGDPAGVQGRLDAVHAERGTPAGLAAHVLAGEVDERLPVAIKALGAAGAPLLAYLDAAAGGPPALATVAAAASGRPAEVLLVLGRDVLPALAGGDDPGGDRIFGADRWRDVAGQPEPRRGGHLVDRYRAALREAGFPLVTAVELATDDGAGELLVFATSSGKSLETFKDALWAVDEYAGVRYRDPLDPERHLLDISLRPHPGPLRRELLGRLAETGPCTVTELRTFTLTDTVYRAGDATRVLTALVASGAVTRSPEHGRLGGDVVIGPGAVVTDPGGG